MERYTAFRSMAALKRTATKYLNCWRNRKFSPVFSATAFPWTVSVEIFRSRTIPENPQYIGIRLRTCQRQQRKISCYLA
ncbi:hypothetical protein KCP75_21145 [Salmonella enterica subsp. enterica]|nr:hypothetical protein KCP75_21145 [Salmonella enterica subsp. enterica]